MLLKLHFIVLYFFTTVNKSVYMHSRIYMGLKKKLLTKNSKLKKKLTENIYYSKKKVARKIILYSFIVFIVLTS